MGTPIIFAVIVLGVFMGTTLFSLLIMAQRTDQIYDRMLRGEEIAVPSNPCYMLA